MATTDLVILRHDLHQHPETGFEVSRTAAIVADYLGGLGLDVSAGVGRTGVVATLNGHKNSGRPAIGLRADMDALPITEANAFSHRSRAPGKFHGCGHDGHTVMLLGAARALSEDKSFDRTVHFIFQPDEENGGGAKAMIEDGLFDRFAMDAIFGLHNMPKMALGQFATQPGAFCAFEDNFEISIAGRGGHASMPDLAIDPIVAGAALVMQLQTIVARAVPAGDHAVVSVTGFETDGARNIIASNARVSGDCRGFKPETSQVIEARMRAIASGVGTTYGADVDVTYANSFPPLVNNHAAVERAVAAISPAGAVESAYGRVGFSEDFAQYLTHRPGAFLLMGNGTDGKHAQPLHNPGYDFNDAAIPYGVAFWTALARNY